MITIECFQKNLLTLGLTGGIHVNKKAKAVLKNIRYTVSANFLVLGTSIILNLIVPKFIGIEEYSFWQLYVFYSGYVGFFHLGWLEGIYLKIGGKDYDSLEKRSLGNQFWYLVIFQSIIAVIIFIYAMILSPSTNKKNIILFVALNLIVSNCKYFILYILQSTNRIKEYAQLSRNDRYIYIVGIGIYIIFGGKNFLPLLIMDIISKTVVLIWGLSKIKDIIFVRLVSIKQIFGEIKDNVKIGSNLMFSNIASMLILGISRLMVERQWNIETFGKLSFTLSISNMFMTFINAVGVVLFPLLRRSSQSNLSSLYIYIRTIFVPISYGLLIFFSPIKSMLNFWLPEYSQSLFFMGILFPMVIYEGRMALLVSTYLKTIRKEKIILLSNAVTLLVSTFFSFISIIVIKNIDIAVLVIMFSLAFRCVLAEKLLSNVLQINLGLEACVESMLTTIFITTNIYCSRWIAMSVYVTCFMVYLFVNAKLIKDSFMKIIAIMKD